ncbi:MAG: hypothetical protein Q4A79_02355 [Candidatus Saccharibacteria bacterium]|nr:hypothetical protein [Candidatus Saccharibacteria bacterium]
MKKDLVSYVLLGIIGVVATYVVCDMLLPSLTSVSFKTLNSDPGYSLAEPNPEIFNFRAINPTVEVYVGECTKYDSNGICLDVNLGDQNQSDNSGSESSSGQDSNGDA